MAVEPTDKATSERYAIAIHGGCGTADRLLPADVQADYRDGLSRALELGRHLLAEGRSSLEVVEAVARAMEDDPLFNAGKGSAFNNQGAHELDASIMDGRTMACGAVAGVRTVKNPISLARLVMQRTDHVLLAGVGAEQFAAQMQVALVDPDYFYTPRLRALWAAGDSSNPPRPDLGLSRGTIGVVALDKQGNLAAATSTGGTSFKMPGRIGDSPIIGAGTYAKNGVCAISCTGRGEEFIRHSVAHTVAALIEYKQMTLVDAAQEVIDHTLAPGVGGIIAVAADGSLALPFNTPAMLRGAADASGRFEVAIWDETVSR
ncbi:MAG: beta-aspartyl-peptidase [Planctomycetales bacterium]|nr:beta-aspartyl-peptidase [Planctomycetales bacterium]